MPVAALGFTGSDLRYVVEAGDIELFVGTSAAAAQSGGARRGGGDGVAVAATAGRQRVVRGAALNQAAGANWAGNVTFAATGVARPRTVAEVQEVVADAARRGERVHAVGARHSFTAVGDTDGVLVDTDALREMGAVDETAATVTVGAGIRYAELAPYLDERGWALGNLPSLPHVSVAGAVATATHGSGDSNPVLADAVRAVDLVTALGERRRLERGDPDAPAAIVGLGAFGVLTHVTLGLVPRFDVAQDVYVDVPFDAGARASGRPARLGLQREPVHRLVDGHVPPGLAQASDHRRPGRRRGRRPDGGAPTGPSDPWPATRRLHHPARPARPVARATGALPRRRHAERR